MIRPTLNYTTLRWVCSALSGIVAGLWLSKWMHGDSELGLVMAMGHFAMCWWFCYRALSDA